MHDEPTSKLVGTARVVYADEKGFLWSTHLDSAGRMIGK